MTMRIIGYITVVTYQKYSDSVGPSPKGGGAEPARPPLNPLQAIVYFMAV